MTDHCNHSKGQVLVEMAIVMPFFLLIILGGIIDFGMAFYNYTKLQQIANDTAEYAAEANGGQGFTQTSPISNYVQNRKPVWWNGSFTVHPPELISTDTIRIIRITLSYECPAYTPFYKSMLHAVSGASSIRLQTSAAYKIPKILFIR